jgi:Ig-like domain CHU_C associated
MKKIYSLLLVFGFLIAVSSSFAQNAIVGSGFSTGWGVNNCSTAGNTDFKFASLITGASGTGTYGVTTVANGTGNQYFRFAKDWSSTYAQYAITPGSDVEITPNTQYSLNTTCTNAGSQFINVGSIPYNYVFKTLNAGTAPTGTFVMFEVQGAVQSVTSQSTSPIIANQAVTVTANLSGALSTGQAVYLRYSTDNFSTSTVAQMTGGGTVYNAAIPAAVNTAGATLKYYMFTSGTANVAANGSNTDLYSINVLNNAGANYSYSVSSNPITVVSSLGTSTFATYANLAAALVAINPGVIHAGTITCYVNAGWAEPAPAGGFQITAAVSNIAATPITFVKSGSGAKPLFTAPAQTANSQTDAVFKIIGSDFVTIDGFDIRERSFTPLAADTAVATNTMTEFGIAFYNTAATNGAQNNTIQNCTITLSSAFQNAIGIWSNCASSPAASATSGTNSNNKIYSNNISNVGYGIYISSPSNLTTTLVESGWDIGGTTVATGNTITFGNAVTNNISGLSITQSLAAGIYVRSSNTGNNIRFNTISSNNLAYAQTGGIGGIINGGTYPTSGNAYTNTISNNSITLLNSGNTALTGIDCSTGLAVGTLINNNNTIALTRSATTAVASTGVMIGIKAASLSASNTANGNNVTINQTFLPASGIADAGVITGITMANATTNTGSLTTTGNTITINQTNGASAAVTATMSGAITGLGIGNSLATGTYTTITCNTNTILINRAVNNTNASGICAYSGAIIGILASSTATTALSIGATSLGNSITLKEGAAGTGTATYTSAVTYISAGASMSTGAFSIVDNQINNTGSFHRSTGATIAISHGGSFTGTATLLINNNTVNINAGATATGPSTLKGTDTNASSSITTGYSITNNNFTLVDNSITSTIVGIQNTDGGTPTKTITGNTINISGFGLSTTGILDNFGTSTISGNTLNLVSSNVIPTLMNGISSSSGTKNITANIFTTLSLNGIMTNAAVLNGISITGSTLSSIYSNTIKNITAGAVTSTGNPIVSGVSISGGTANNVYKNNIYSITSNCNGATGVVNGIVLTGGTTNNVFNNLISGLTAPSATNTDAIRGISMPTATTSNTNNLFYNTIYLTGSGGATNFGASGIYQIHSATGTTAKLTMNNNLVVNNITPNGSGLAVAFRRSAASVAADNYQSGTSNNNSFYAGTASANNLIYYDGTNSDQTLSTFKTRVGSRETASVSVNPTFISTTVSNADYLRIAAGGTTPLESGGTAITLPVANGASSTSYDYWDITRPFPSPANGGTGVDIGASEFDGIKATPTVNNLVTNITGTQCSPTARIVSAQVTPVNPLSANPVINYSVNGVAQTAISMTASSTTATGASVTAGGLGSTGYWIGTIPTTNTTPANATITWSVSATDGTLTGLANGTSYSDAPLTGVTVTANSSSASLCAGGITNLSATISSLNKTIGDAAGTSISTTGTPYRTGTTTGTQQRNQYLVLASELTAQGLTAGSNINKISFNVSTVGPTGYMSNVAIDMANTTATALTSTFLTPTFTNVFTASTYAPISGLNTHTFSTPFVWDGTSNVVINMCGTLTAAGAGLGTTLVTSTTPGGIIATVANSTATGCTDTTGATTLSNQRPQFIFATSVPFASYAWSTGATATTNAPFATNTTGIQAGVVVNAVPTTYWVTATTAAGCPITSSVTVNAATSLGGVYSVGASNISGETGHFSTLTAAVAAYNTSCLTAAVEFVLTDTTYGSETFPITINSNSYASSTFTLTIKPNAGVAVAFSGASVASSSLIKLNGADYVIIDGLNSGGSSMSITNTFVGTAANIWIASASASDGATNNTIRNLTLAGGTGSNANTATILSGDTTTFGGAALVANSNNTINNNTMTNAQNGIFVSGLPAGPDQNWAIYNNTLGSTTLANKLTFRGVLVQGVNNFNIYGNTVAGVNTPATSTGIATGITVSATSSNGSIYNNIIRDIKQNNTTTATACYGIGLSTGTAANIKVYNNFVSEVASVNGSATAATNGHGIAVTTGSGYHIYHNTVSMNTNQGLATSVPAALYVGSGISAAGAVNVVNNIFSNTQSSGSATRYAIYSGAANTVFGTINNNDYYSSGTNTGFIASNRVALADIVTGFGQNAASVSTLPNFISSTDLHMVVSTNQLINAGAQVLAAPYNVDIDGNPRDAATPDIGADEYIQPNLPLVTAVSIAAGACSGPRTVTATVDPNTNTLSTVVINWSIGAVAQAPITMTAGTGTTTTAGTWTGQIPGNPTVVNGNVITWSVTATEGTNNYFGSKVGVGYTESSIGNDVILFNAVSGATTYTSICVAAGTAGTTSNITASCAAQPGMTYAWSVLSGAGTTLSSINTATVTVTASVTSTIQVIGTPAGGGCPTTAVYSVGVYPLPAANVTTTQNGVCPGTSATIGSGLTVGNFTVSSTPYAASVAPATAGVLYNGTTLTTPLSGGSSDDGGWSGIPLGFTFNYFGINFSTISAGTNGLLMFGTPPGYGTAAGQLGQFAFVNTVVAPATTPEVFPNPGNPGNVIALMAADGYAAQNASGSIKYWTEGVAPNRIFVIEYKNHNFYSNNPAYTAQCKLYETTGVVEVHVGSKTFTGSGDTLATIGLQNANGTIGATAPGRKQFSAQITTPEAWRFSPPANYSINWTYTDATHPTPTALASGTTTGVAATDNLILNQTVSPAVTTTYYISYTNTTTGCTSAAGANTQVTMNIFSPVVGTVDSGTVSGASFTAATTKTVCAGSSITLGTSYVQQALTDTYVWQSSAIGANSWTDVSPAITTPTYTFSPSTSLEYRLQIITCGGSPGYSIPITLNVNAPTAVTLTADQTVCNNTYATLTASSAYSNYSWSVTGSPTTYTNLFTDTAGTPYTGTGNYATIYVKSATGVTTSYTCTANDGICTATAVSVVSTMPVVTGVSSSVSTICISGVPTLSLTPATGYGNGIVEWYESTDGTNYGSVVSTGTTYTPGSMAVTTYYKAVVKDSAGNTCVPLASAPSVMVTLNNPIISSVSGATSCGASSLSLSAVGSGLATYNWYSAATGGTLLQSSASNTYTTPSLTATTDYWVSAAAAPQQVTNIVGTSAYSNVGSSNAGYGTYFSTTNASVINSVAIYPATAGTLTITLKNTAGTTVATQAFTIAAGDVSTTVLKTLTFTPGLMAIPAGQAGWQLYYDIGINRESGTYAYPYTSAIGFTLTGNSIDGVTASVGGTRIYMYNWNVTATTPCESSRSQVTATISTAPDVVLSATTNATPVCAGQPTPSVFVTSVMNGATDVGAGYYNNYQWSPTTGVTGTSATGWTFSNYTNTVYTLTANNVDGNGDPVAGTCVDLGTFSLVLAPSPTRVDITTADAVVCKNKLQAVTATGGTVLSNVTTESFNALSSNFTLNNVTSSGTATVDNTYFTEGTGSIILTTTNFTTNFNYAQNVNYDLSGSTSATLTFSHIAALEGSGTSYDYGYVEYSINGGSTWLPFLTADYVGSAATSLFTASTNRFSTKSYADWISTFTAASSVPTVGSALWKTETFNVPAAALASSQFRIRFRCTTDSTQNFYGWLIDNVRINKISPKLEWSATNADIYTDATGSTPYIAPPTGTVYPSTVYVRPTTGIATITASASLAGACPLSDVLNLDTNTGTSTYSDPSFSGASWDNTNYLNGNTSLIIDAPLTTTTDLVGCDCTINSGAGDIVISSGTTLNLTNGLTVNALSSLTFENGASLLQENSDSSINAGNILFKRNTGVFVNDYDFAYFGSPVIGQQIKKLWMTTENDTFFSYNATLGTLANNYVDGWEYVSPNDLMTNGRGYIARTHVGSSNSSYEMGNTTYTITDNWLLPFKGTPFNGTTSTPIANTNAPATIGGVQNSNYLANPYPSAIDIELLKADNPSVSSKFYFWTHNNQLGSNLQASYDSSTYVHYSTVLHDGVGLLKGVKPNQYIGSGQGFFVDGTANGAITFKNSQRVASNNTRFYRSASTSSIAIPKLWLNLKHATLTAQQLIGYVAGATNGYDSDIDIDSPLSGNIHFYGVLPNNIVVLQGRAIAFTDADIIPLGYKGTNAGTYTISIDHSGNNDTFWDQSQHVYLQDNDLGVDFDLSTGDYVFTTAAGMFNNRFVLKFTSALSTDDNEIFDSSVIVAKDKNLLKVKSSIEDIKSIVVYDLLGRKVYSKDAINNKDFSDVNIVRASQTLIVKITLANGVIVSKKIVY